MKYSTIAFTLFVSTVALTSCNSSRRLIRPDCESFTRTTNESVIAAGLWDHTQMSPEWLVEELRPDNVDAWIDQYMPLGLASKTIQTHDDSLLAVEIRQFLREDWDRLSALSKPGDRFFYYTTPDNYWGAMAGQDGIVLIRGCEIVARAILTQN
jgi:hypothetical protein